MAEPIYRQASMSVKASQATVKAGLRIEHRSGDIFNNAPPGTIFIHSCNCKGHWGRGIALELKKRFPAAFDAQREYCSANGIDQILGKSMLLNSPDSTVQPTKGRPLVACLFTKRNIGPVKNEAETIEVLKSTNLAMQHLVDGLSILLQKGELVGVQELRLPKINAGLFNVEWQRTLDALSQVVVPSFEANKAFPRVVVYTL